MGTVRSLGSSCNPQKTITADDHKNDKSKGAKNEISIFVIVDSMAKHLNGWENLFRYKNNMNNFVKPSVKRCPDHFILHVGTNDLPSDKSSEEIARSIIDLAI